MRARKMIPPTVLPTIAAVLLDLDGDREGEGVGDEEGAVSKPMALIRAPSALT
jgi:hypothetical protein